MAKTKRARERLLARRRRKSRREGRDRARKEHLHNITSSTVTCDASEIQNNGSRQLLDGTHIHNITDRTHPDWLALDHQVKDFQDGEEYVLSTQKKVTKFKHSNETRMIETRSVSHESLSLLKELSLALGVDKCKENKKKPKGKETEDKETETKETESKEIEESNIMPAQSTMMFAAVEPGMVEFSTIQNCLTLIRDTLEVEAQMRSWGTILLYGTKQEEMRPTIMFGFRDASRIRTVQSSRFPLPTLVVTDEATSAGILIPSSTWINETREMSQVNITDASLGLKNNLDEGGSFGGWWRTGLGQMYGLTCAHTMPNGTPGSVIVSPSSLELTARLQVYLPYSSLGLQSHGISSKKNDVCHHLISRYEQSEHYDGAEMKDGKRKALAGDPLGTFKVAEMTYVPILQTHNRRLSEDKQFALESGIPLASRLDWAIFEPVNARIGQNYVEAEDVNVIGVGDLMAGDIILKSGRTTGTTRGMVSQVSVIIWEDGVSTSEIAVVAYPNSNEFFGNKGDSGALVFRFTATNSVEAVGLLVGKSSTPIWTAVTPIRGIMDRISARLGVSLELALC